MSKKTGAGPEGDTNRTGGHPFEPLTRIKKASEVRQVGGALSEAMSDAEQADRRCRTETVKQTEDGNESV